MDCLTFFINSKSKILDIIFVYIDFHTKSHIKMRWAGKLFFVVVLLCTLLLSNIFVQTGSVLTFSELMFNPSETNGEFVEIYNSSTTEKGEMQIGGVIYSDSADKATRFIMNCNQKKIPLVFLQDVIGFMFGSKAEHGGIIKDGAKMVNAVTNSVVPKITIIIGNSFSAGNYAMCGKAYDPRFIFAYPNAKIAVMGGAQASSVLLDIRIKQGEKSGIAFTEEQKKKLLNEIIQSYEETSNPLHAAARLWVDEIIDPALTRHYIFHSIEYCNNNPKILRFNPGVI